jgi:hypothetical protein
VDSVFNPLAVVEPREDSLLAQIVERKRRRATSSDPRLTKSIGRYGALLPLFRLVGVRCIAALWRVKSLLRHRSDRPKLEHQSVKVALTLATAK